MFALAAFLQWGNIVVKNLNNTRKLDLNGSTNKYNAETFLNRPNTSIYIQKLNKVIKWKITLGSILVLNKSNT